MADTHEFDVVVVGASLAGSATAILLGRQGARVALVERSPNPEAFKRLCTHYIQASAVPTLQRLGLLEKIEAAGGVRSSGRFWTRWGTITTPPEVVPPGVNLRREKLDPLVRGVAAAEPGVELMLGEGVCELVYDDDGAVAGTKVRARDGRTRVLRSQLVVGADGRHSSVAKLAGVRRRETPHGRLGFGAYYEGPSPADAPDATVWFMDPEWAAAFPTDSGLTFYGCMLTKDHLPDFRRDREQTLERFISNLPDAPPIDESRRVSPVIGQIEMPNVMHRPVAPGLALVGDAALATDPLFGVGCGWAFQSAEWLADAVAPALRGEAPLSRGLARYRRRHRRRLGVHAQTINDYATGRRMTAMERMVFSAAARDPATVGPWARFGTRSAGASALAEATARAALFHLRRRVRPGRAPRVRPSPAIPRAAEPIRPPADRSPAVR